MSLAVPKHQLQNMSKSSEYFKPILAIGGITLAAIAINFAQDLSIAGALVFIDFLLNSAPLDIDKAECKLCCNGCNIGSSLDQNNSPRSGF